jgi:H+/Na+-translocating ferredoxin:NAD+ oxidoreductase subunit C
MITVLEKPIPFGGGIKLLQNKAHSLKQPLAKAKLPDVIKIPLVQHIGSAATPIVKAGDTVLKGQLIAEAEGYISAPVHASTSGVVKEIAEYAVPNSSCEKSECIVIETDSKETWIKDRTPIDDHTCLSPAEIQQKIFQAGIVGLAGIGFPSALKIIPGLTSDIELLIINAAECDPYISCDESLIRHYSKALITGIEILAHTLQLKECVIALEEDKTETIEVLKRALEKYTGIEIRLTLVSSLYPAGAEKQLIKSITGIEVPAERLPVDMGIVVYNVATTVAVKKAIIDDEPLISRIVTVTGSGISQPCNIEVLFGTPINEIIEQCGGYNEQFKYLIMGGPMMGFRMHSDKVPLIKTTNCLLAAGPEFYIPGVEESACTRCDECAPVCPVNLQPQQLHWYSKEFDSERLEDFNLFDCIECGCCSYVCPSHIPLVDKFRQAKSHVTNKRHKQYQADQNKKRYLNKLARKAKQEEEKEKKRLEKKSKNKDDALKKKQDAIAAAVSRVKQKRKEKK